MCLTTRRISFQPGNYTNPHTRLRGENFARRSSAMQFERVSLDFSLQCTRFTAFAHLTVFYIYFASKYADYEITWSRERESYYAQRITGSLRGARIKTNRTASKGFCLCAAIKRSGGLTHFPDRRCDRSKPSCLR